MNAFTLCGDCLEELKTFADNKFDAIITDPPYGLSFMGKKWDYDVPSVEIWKECLRVLKPGGHLLSFSSARTYHRMVVNVEDAGFEIRDQIMWVYGSGFPKSHNVGKTLPEWEGWGTALKPAHEPIVLARKPLSEKTVAENVLKWGTGAINIDKSRIGTGTGKAKTVEYPDITGDNYNQGNEDYSNRKKITREVVDQGRFPANFIHDGIDTEWSRFFYCAKAGKKERNAGCEDLPDKEWMLQGLSGSVAEDGVSNKGGNGTVRGVSKNNHPTVKPQKLMTYLCGLITPTNGTILDPFMGSGSTGVAAVSSGYSFVGIDREPDYVEISRLRLENRQR
jgi:site-specific DNA-methyltransferase (adenine-specific)